MSLIPALQRQADQPGLQGKFQDSKATNRNPVSKERKKQTINFKKKKEKSKKKKI